jgi:hypothetical protein
VKGRRKMEKRGMKIREIMLIRESGNKNSIKWDLRFPRR